MQSFEELFREQLEVEAEIAHLKERSKKLTAEMMRLAGMGKRSVCVEMASGDSVILTDCDVTFEILEGE